MYLDAFPEMMTREAIEHRHYFRKAVSQVELEKSTLEFAHVPFGHSPSAPDGESGARPSDIEAILEHASQAIDESTPDRQVLTGQQDVLPEPALDLRSATLWPNHFEPGPIRAAVQQLSNFLGAVSNAPYQWFVAGGAVGAIVAVPLISVGSLYALIPLAVCIFCDGLDGGVLRRQGAGNSAIYLSCLMSHFNDIILFIGIIVFTYQHEASNHLSTIAFLGAVAMSFFSSFARAALYQTGIEVPKTWLERGIRLVAVVAAVASGSVWSATWILAAFAILELGYILHLVRTTRVAAIYSFVHLQPSGRRRIGVSSASSEDRWIKQVRDSERHRSFA